MGCTQRPLNVTYAADELAQLLTDQSQASAVSKQLKLSMPAIDLSYVELCGQYWLNVRFDWLGGRFMMGIDLRSANLAGAHMAGAYLAGAHLQCANLSGADLRGATLTGADLRGANLSGARFGTLSRGRLVNVSLRTWQLEGVVGTARGLTMAANARSPAASWQSVCRGRYMQFHQMAATPPATSPPGSSPAPASTLSGAAGR